MANNAAIAVPQALKNAVDALAGFDAAVAGNTVTVTGKADGSNFTYQALDTRTSSIISTLTSEASKTTANGLEKATDRAIYRIAAPRRKYPQDPPTMPCTPLAPTTLLPPLLGTSMPTPTRAFRARSPLGTRSPNPPVSTSRSSVAFQDQMTLNLTGSQGDLSTVLASWNGTSFNNNTIVMSFSLRGLPD